MPQTTFLNHPKIRKATRYESRICVSPFRLQRRPVPFRLEAQWACFFDQANWKWEYEPMDLVGWMPTFRVEFHAVTPSAQRLMCF